MDGTYLPQGGEAVRVDLGTWTYGKPDMALAVLPKTPSLAQIKRLQDVVGAVEQVECPVEHHFAPGLYTRRCYIPAGAVVVGKMHRHQHPTMLIKGTATINTNKGMERISAPYVWISQPDAKRALYAHTDCEFVTVHLNPDDTTDLDVIEERVIVPEALIDYDKEVVLMEGFANELQAVYA